MRYANCARSRTPLNKKSTCEKFRKCLKLWCRGTEFYPPQAIECAIGATRGFSVRFMENPDYSVILTSWIDLSNRFYFWFRLVLSGCFWLQWLQFGYSQLGGYKQANSVQK